MAVYGGRADLMEWVAPMGPVYQAGTRPKSRRVAPASRRLRN